MGVSLKIVLSGFVTLTVIITALVAFLPLYLSGLDSVESAVDTIRSGIIDRSKDNVQAYFKQGTDAAEAVSRATYYGTLNFQDAWDNQPKMDLVNFLFSMLAKGNGTYTTASILSQTPPWNLKVDSRPSGRGGVGAQTVLSNTNSTYFTSEVWRNIPGNTKNTSFEMFAAAVNFPFPRPTLDGKEIPIMNGGQPAWSLPFFSFDDVGILVGAPIYVNRVATGAFTLAMLPDDINNFLGRIGLSAGGRAMVFDARTPEGTVIGNSWGQAGGVLTGINAFSQVRSGDLLPLTNLSDALMNKVIDTYGLAQVVNGTVPFAKTMGKKESDRTYVDIIGVTDDYGLNLRVVIAMPLIDFLGDFYDSRSIVIGILVAAVVLLVAVAVMFAVLLTRPLDRLGDRMYMTASLQDSGEDDPASALSEIADMQEAYVTMKAELARMKSYLPQSVLQQDDDEDEGETATSIAGSSSMGGSSRRSVSQSHRGDDRSSMQSSRHSSDKSSKVIAAPGRGGLNLAGAALSKRATVLACNAVGYHGKASGSAASTHAIQNRITGKVAAAIRDQKGVIDFFQGDHFVATWNAVGNVGGHQKRAAVAALAVKEAFASEGFEAKMGAASSTVVVGNMGSDDMKRFNIIGRAYSLATKLMRHCAKYANLHTLLHQSMSEEVGLEMYLQIADILRVAETGSFAYAFSLQGPKSVGTDEWMYQLEEGESKDPYAAANKVVELLAEGNIDDAKERIAKLQTAGDKVVELRAFQLAEAILAAGSAAEYVNTQ